MNENSYYKFTSKTDPDECFYASCNYPIAGEGLLAALAYLDIREKVNSLGAVIDIITDENKAILDAVKSIETLYEEAEKIDFRPYAKATEALDNTLRLLPDKIWVE